MYRLKFNSGRGAIVCNNCDRIVKEPATEEDLEKENQTECPYCKK